MKKVLCIVGPTGSGKTALSIRLAKAFGMEVINGDSVQVYKRLDIGSARIKEDEKEGIAHYLFDMVDPRDKYSVYEFQQDVRKKIDDIKRPMIVGGTGLYIKAALYDYEFEEVGRSKDFESTYEHVDTADIYLELKVLDPNIAIDPQNRRRVIRALEQAKLGYLRSDKKRKDDMLYDALILYLDIDRDLLEERLYKRLDTQLEEGFIEEVQSLLDDGIEVNAIGYKELASYLKGAYDLDEAKYHIVKNSRRLAKKQKTWFKNQMQPVMLDALSDTLYEDAYKIVEKFLKE